MHQEYICKGTVLTEDLLNTRRGPQAPKRTRKILFSQVGPKQMKEREEERKWDGTSAPGEGAEGEERFTHPGKSHHRWGDQLGQKGSSEVSEESTTTGVLKARWRKICTEGWCQPALSSLRHCLLICWHGSGLSTVVQALEFRSWDSTGTDCYGV